MSEVELGSPMSGWLMSVRDVKDPVFSEEMMGAGVAIDPTEGVVVAPCDARVILVAPSRHSVTLRAETGAELLIHVGLETVSLNGRGFEAHVRDGDHVKTGDRLISFDLDSVGLAAKSLVSPIVLTNDAGFDWSAEPLDRLVQRGEAIGTIRGGATFVAGAAVGGDAVTRVASVRFEHGLHARPAARLAECAKHYASEVTIKLRDKSAAARSPVAVMALDARHEDTVDLSAIGPDAAAAIDAIAALLEAGERSEPTAAPTRQARAVRDNEIAGVCALPGAVLGTAKRWQRRTAEISENGRGVEAESAALKAARAKVRDRLRCLGDQAGGPAAAIAQAHMGLLDDETIDADAVAAIAQGRSAARAWQVASEAAADVLRSSDNVRLRERVADIEDVATQVVAALIGAGAPGGVDLPETTVLLADQLLPSELMSLPRDRVVGLATSGGGPTSHMAIIAASFGIPTLVAVGPKLHLVPDGAPVLLDASAGILVIGPDERERERVARTAAAAGGYAACSTSDGERVSLLANLGGIDEVERAVAAGAEGCGLLRTEFLFLDRSEPPSRAEQRDVYQAIAEALGGRPLTIRTLDIGGDKPVPYIRFPDEQNPALGARGIRTGLFEPDLIDEQLRAIADLRSDGLKVMLPMVSSADELRAVRRRFGELGGQAKLGVMVETPAAALIGGRLAAEADFLSIGSNDLAQYVLAMDRTNPLLAASIDALHPAVLRLIAMTAEAGRAAGTPVSLCGSLASEPAGALVLVGFGIRELSAVPAAIPAVRQAIARVSAADCRALSERALSLESAAEVRALAAELLQGDAR